MIHPSSNIPTVMSIVFHFVEILIFPLTSCTSISSLSTAVAHRLSFIFLCILQAPSYFIIFNCNSFISSKTAAAVDVGADTMQLTDGVNSIMNVCNRKSTYMYTRDNKQVIITLHACLFCKSQHLCFTCTEARTSIYGFDQLIKLAF